MEPEVLFKCINELIISLSKLAWPIFTFTFILIFRKNISSLLPRLKKGKLFGQEFELDSFKEQVQKTESEVQKRLSDVEKYKKIDTEESDDSQIILKAATADPKLGIIQLATIIEKNIRLLAGSLGFIDVKSTISVKQIFKILVESGDVPKHAIKSLQIFWELRNKIVHGRNVKDTKMILEILDIGLDLLKSIKSLPHPIYTVYKSNIDLYSDDNLETIRENVKGVIIEPRTMSGAKYDKKILPTTLPNYYKQQMVITWEFDLKNTWGRTWYINPDSNDKKIAWDSAGEFTGKKVDV